MKHFFKKLIWDLKGGYKPRQFWDSWSKTFMEDEWQIRIHPQHVWIKEKIVSGEYKTILEVGCGFGRNIKFLIESGVSPKNITGADISSEMIKKAKKYIGLRGISLKTSDVTNMSFHDSEFDVILSHGVLMHVSPQLIHQALDEMIRVAKKGIVIIEQNYGGNEYTFIHNYKKLFQKKDVSIVEYKNDKQLGLDLMYVKIRK